MEFRPNISPVDVIKKGAFGGAYFRDVIPELEFSDIDDKYYGSDFYDVDLNCHGVKGGTSLRFWEKKGWIMK